MSISRRLRPIVVPAAAFLLSLPCAELAFRAFDGGPSGSTDGIYEPFADGSFKARPGVRTFLDWYPRGFHVATDALGLRVDHRTPAPAAPATRPLLVLGDSQGFGNGVDYHETIAGGVERLLQDRGVRVALAATGGHTFRDQVELMRWLVRERGLAPRAVLVLVSPRMLTQIDDRSRVVVHAGTLYDRPPTLAMRLRSWLARSSKTWTTLRNAVHNLGPRDTGDGVGPNRYYDPAQLRGELDAKVAAVLGEVVAEARSTGARVVLAYLPFALEAAMETPTGPEGEAERVRAEVPWTVLQRAAARVDLPVVDLRPALRKVASAGLPLALAGDPHYGIETSAACADLLAGSPELISAVETRK